MMILAKLKEATREQHTNLENVVSIMDNTLTRSKYEALLTKFYRFYSAIEPLIAFSGLERTAFNFDERRKTPLLEFDFANLGIDRSSIAGEWTDLPVIDSPAKAFGTLYVLEGATLGGQVIKRHLKQHFGIDAASGGAFFNSYGDQVGPMWKAFGVEITAFAEKEMDDETIINAARETFDSFARCFSAGNAKAHDAGTT